MTEEWWGMGSEWFNPVLSPYRRQHRIKSFRPHSIPSHLISILLSEREVLIWLEWLRNDVEMGSEWFNPVLSPYRRQHRIKKIWGWSYIALAWDVFEVDLAWMTEEWCGMGSEWFNPVLSPYRRQHRIKSFRPHFNPSQLIPIQFW